MSEVSGVRRLTGSKTNRIVIKHNAMSYYVMSLPSHNPKKTRSKKNFPDVMSQKLDRATEQPL